MNITLRIKRYQPENGGESKFQDFKVPIEPTDRLLDALMFVKRNLDGTLCFRKSCAHGVCGSDAMTINGVERLACKTLVQDVVEKEDAVVTLEPLRSLPVQRDLMVDYTHFFETYRIVKPFLIPVKASSGNHPQGWHGLPAHENTAKMAVPQYSHAMPPIESATGGENIQTPEQRKKFDDPTKCILCACCYAACPVVAETDPEFIGPAAVAQAARFVFDSRDEGLAPRLEVLDDPHGVWPCENHFNCTRVCPRGIKVTKNINLVKRTIMDFKEQGH
jgi:succinate dehydrogenase / fumarate reductase iron-sulfur subunit